MAGSMVGIGATSYLSCSNKYIGAILFTIGLYAICSFEMSLFTGMSGYTRNIKDLLNLCVVYVGNYLGAGITAFLITTAKPEIRELSVLLCYTKVLNDENKIMVLSFMCGVIMHIAVHSFRIRGDLSRYLGIFLCVPVFILCGFEHSVANAFYLVAANYDFGEAFAYMFLVTSGNAAGAIIFSIAHDYISKKDACEVNK